MPDPSRNRTARRLKHSHARQGSPASEFISKRIAELGDWRGETLRRMRKLIKEADPDVVEEWKWMGTPVWSHDGIICTGESYKSVVKLTFSKGASLKDPARLFNSSLDGNVRRAIDIHEGEEVAGSAFKALIRQAVALNSCGKAKPSKPAVVDEFLRKLRHPLLPVALAVREAILQADPNIGEEIKWNAPAFLFTASMEEGDPKEYRRYLVVFNFYRKDCLRLVFWHGDRAKDKSGFLQGDYSDGRRLATISSTADLALKRAALRKVLRAQIKHLATYGKG